MVLRSFLLLPVGIDEGLSGRLLSDRDPRELWERATTMSCDVLRRGWGENKSLVEEGKRGPEVNKVVIKTPPMDASNSMIVKGPGSSGTLSMDYLRIRCDQREPQAAN